MKSPIKACRASRVASIKEDAFPVMPRHFHVYSSLERSSCLVMATVRGKSLSIVAISCSSSRLASSEVSTTCVSPSRHQMHSQYELCSFKPFTFCVSRSNCFNSVILLFSLSISLQRGKQEQCHSPTPFLKLKCRGRACPHPGPQPSTTTTNLVVIPQPFLGRRSALIETWPSVRGNKKHPGYQRPRCYCVSSSISFFLGYSNSLLYWFMIRKLSKKVAIIIRRHSFHGIGGASFGAGSSSVS